MWIKVAALGVTLGLTACGALVEEVPTLSSLPTLTPSPFASPTPAIPDLGTATPVTPTASPTVTLTAVSTPTPLFALVPTLSFQELTSGPQQPTDLPVPRPKINYFVAFPTQAKPGETVLLFWSTSNATSAAVTRIYQGGKRGTSYGVQIDGSIPITADGKDRNQTYLLSVTNGITTVTKSLVIQVSCEINWFFVPFPDSGCPDGEPLTAAASTQQFEHGRMFWNSSTNIITVVFNDWPTVPDPKKPAWISLLNPWQNGMPADDPSLQPPPGLKQPVNAFGKVWRETPGVSDRLGWATGDETGYTVLFQTQAGESKILFFSDPSNAVLGLTPNGQGWQMVGQIGTPTPEPSPTP